MADWILLLMESGPSFLRHTLSPSADRHKNVIIIPQNKNNFVIWVVFFMRLAYNKKVVTMLNNFNKSVKECIYGTIDFE